MLKGRAVLEWIVWRFLRAYAPPKSYVYKTVRDGIRSDRKPSEIIYEFLKKSGWKGVVTHIALRYYADAAICLAEEGREYSHKFLDDFLDYFAFLAKSKRIERPP
jgi:hypothetical protein